jgi:hypothetical protein
MSVDSFNKTLGTIARVDGGGGSSGGSLKIFQQTEQPSEDGLWIKTSVQKNCLQSTTPPPYVPSLRNYNLHCIPISQPSNGTVTGIPHAIGNDP